MGNSLTMKKMRSWDELAIPYLDKCQWIWLEH
jgi:hypothetical protein